MTFLHKLKCSSKLVGVILLYLTPLCMLFAVIVLMLRFFMWQRIEAFDQVLNTQFYLRIGVLFAAIHILFSLIIALSGAKVPDTNIAGYRHYIFGKLRD